MQPFDDFAPKGEGVQLVRFRAGRVIWTHYVRFDMWFHIPLSKKYFDFLTKKSSRKRLFNVLNDISMLWYSLMILWILWYFSLGQTWWLYSTLLAHSPNRHLSSVKDPFLIPQTIFCSTNDIVDFLPWICEWTRDLTCDHVTPREYSSWIAQ